MGLTAELGQFLEKVRFEDLPEDTIAQARDAFADTVGVIMAGIDEPIVGAVHKGLLMKPQPPEARGCLSALEMWAPEAALISGSAGHALDYDDQSLTGHPSVILVPALLAEGEFLKSPGRDLVLAYVAGYEVWAELVRRSTNYHRKGWHPTSVFGVVAVAAACSVLRRMNAERSMTAMAIAGSYAGGLAVNFGTDIKPFHAGKAAHDGICATRLSAAGATASLEAFENHHGFLTAFAPDMTSADWDSPAQLGKDWYLTRHRLCVKKYPTCYFMHRSFDSTVKLLAGKNLKPDDISEIEVTMGKGQTAVLVNERPKTGLQAKFSEQFAMAAAVILGHMGIEDLRDDVVQRKDMQAFYPKVKLNPVDEYDPRDMAHSPTESVSVKLTNGRVLSTGAIASIKGHANDPLTLEELWQKFKECTAKTHTEAEAQLLFDKCQDIVNISSTRELPTCRTILREDSGVQNKRVLESVAR